MNSSEIRKVAQCVYLACDESIAVDISVKCKRIADAYDKLQADNEQLSKALCSTYNSVRMAYKQGLLGDELNWVEYNELLEATKE